MLPILCHWRVKYFLLLLKSSTIKALDTATDFSIWVVIFMLFYCLNADFSIWAFLDFWMMAFSTPRQLYYNTIYNSVPILFQCRLFFNPRQWRSKQVEWCIYAVGHRDLYICDMYSRPIWPTWPSWWWWFSLPRDEPFCACWHGKGSIWLTLWVQTCARALGHISTAACVISTFCTIGTCWNSHVSCWGVWRRPLTHIK